jgi:hypothetical protein
LRALGFVVKEWKEEMECNMPDRVIRGWAREPWVVRLQSL